MGAGHSSSSSGSGGTVCAIFPGSCFDPLSHTDIVEGSLDTVHAVSSDAVNASEASQSITAPAARSDAAKLQSSVPGSAGGAKVEAATSADAGPVPPTSASPLHALQQSFFAMHAQATAAAGNLAAAASSAVASARPEAATTLPASSSEPAGSSTPQSVSAFQALQQGFSAMHAQASAAAGSLAAAASSAVRSVSAATASTDVPPGAGTALAQPAAATAETRMPTGVSTHLAPGSGAAPSGPVGSFAWTSSDPLAATALHLPNSPSASFDAGSDDVILPPPQMAGMPPSGSRGSDLGRAPVSFDSDVNGPNTGRKSSSSRAGAMPPLYIPAVSGAVNGGGITSAGGTPRLSSAASSACTSPRGSYAGGGGQMSPAALRLHLNAVAEVQSSRWGEGRNRAALGSALRKTKTLMQSSPRAGAGAGAGGGSSHEYDDVQRDRLQELRAQQAAAQQALARSMEVTVRAHLAEHVEELMSSSPSAAAAAT
jgi:hypothetical protein